MSTEQKKASPGRPSSYDPEFALQAELACAELGATDKDLAELFKVCLRTVHYWKNRYPDFGQAVRQGKEAFDTNRVERSLLQAALGGTYEEVYEQGGQVVKKVTKHKAPDVKACLFWLKNRQPQRWRDKAEMASDLGEDLAELLEKARKRISAGDRLEQKDGLDNRERAGDE